jgi:hypothetical protein
MAGLTVLNTIRQPYPPISPEHEYLIREFEKLLDEKLSVSIRPLNVVKQPLFAPAAQPPLNAVKPEVWQSSDQEVLKSALQAILTRFDAGVEPTASEISEELEVESRPLGRIMSAAGLQAVNCHRGGKKARRYTFKLRSQIAEILASELEK